MRTARAGADRATGDREADDARGIQGGRAGQAQRRRVGAPHCWLGRTITTETAKAADVAKQKVEKENRGFFNFGSEEPINAHLSGEFRTFGKGKTYTLDNGQVWQQIDDAQLVVRPLTNPEVNIKPAIIGNSWYMAVGHYNSRAQVRRIK